MISFRVGSSPIIKSIILTVLMVSCGLPETVFLQSPAVSYVRDPDSNEYDLLFKNSSNSKNVFIGYEVYYKIYDPINSSATLYSSDRDSIDDSSLAANKVLSNYGFSRLFFSTTPPSNEAFIHDNRTPSLPIDLDLLNVSFQIRLLFKQKNENVTDSFYAAIFDSDYSFAKTPYFYRYVDNVENGNFGIAKLFDISDFDLNDSDMPKTITNNNYEDTDNLYISFYVMSYGIDQANLNDVYSEPEYLGTLKFDVDITDIANNNYE